MDELGIEPPPPRDEESNWVDTLLYTMLACLVVAFLFSRSGCDPAARLKELASAFAAKPDDGKAQALEENSEAAAYISAYNQAVSLANAQRWAEALPHAERAARADSSKLGAAQRALAPLLRGQILTQLRRYDEAIWAIEQARSYTSGAKLHEALATAYFQQQDYRQTLAHARDVIDGGGKTSPYLYFMLAWSYDRLGDSDQANQWLARGRSEFPNDANLNKIAQRYGREAANERGMSTTQSGRFVVKFQDIQEQAGLRDSALRALDGAYSRVCDAYGFQPREALPVTLYPTSGSYYGASGAPQWSAAQFDGKIRVPLSTAASQGLEAVVAHEMTHYVIHEIVGSAKVPAWLDEGLAQMAEGRDEAWANQALAGVNGRFTLAQLENSFLGISDPVQARVAYAQSLLTTRRLVDQIGMGRMRSILDQLAQGRRLQDLVDVR